MSDMTSLCDDISSPQSLSPLSIDEERVLASRYVPKERVMAWTGPRGSGKSLCMTWFAVDWMATTGLPLYSNIAIDYKGLKSLPLDFIDFATQSLNTCCVCIDEMQLWGDRRNWNTTRSKILAYVQMQLRKEKLTFMFTIQDINWMDKRMGFQVDTLCECTDEYFRNQHNRKLVWRVRKPGQFIQMEVKDISGCSTGVPYYKSGVSHIRRMGPCDTFWNAYDTGETQDVSEAWTKYEMKGRKVVLSTEPPGDASMIDDDVYADHRPKVADTIRDIVTNYRGAGNDIVDAAELRNTCALAGIELSPTAIGKHLAKMGVVGKQTRKGTYYDIKGVY